MNQTRQIAAAVVVSMLTLATWTRAETPATPPTVPAAEKRSDAMLDKVLPELSVDGVSLEDFLNYLHDVVPGFQSVLVQSKGALISTVPEMKLKNVTIGQALKIIQEANPAIEFHVVEAENRNPVLVFNLHSPANTGSDVAPVKILKVYRLSDVIESLLARKSDRIAGPPAKKVAEQAALNDVLSLIKAALGETVNSTFGGGGGGGGGGPGGSGNDAGNPVIQIHEATQTLLVRGTAKQIDAVDKVLAALTDSTFIERKLHDQETVFADERAKYRDQIAIGDAALQAAKFENERLRLANQELNDTLMKAQRESDRFRAAKESQTRPDGSKQ